MSKLEVHDQTHCLKCEQPSETVLCMDCLKKHAPKVFDKIFLAALGKLIDDYYDV